MLVRFARQENGVSEAVIVSGNWLCQNGDGGEKMEKQVQLPLKSLRKRKNVTQKELAEELHLSFQTISKWENGVSHS